MGFRFIHAADLHLDTPFEGIARVDPSVAEVLREASLEAFNRLIDYAIAQDAAFVLFAGDIYDGLHRGVRAQIVFHQGLQRLSDAGIYSFVVHGNHDPVEASWSAIREWPPLVKVFGHEGVEHVIVEREGEAIATVYGISFARKAEEENLALRFRREDLPGLQVGMLHCNVSGDPDHDLYSPCSIADLESVGFDYWALGHIHKRQNLKDGHPWIVYPGNLQGRGPKTGEQGAKGALVVGFDGTSVHPPEFEPFDIVRFAELRLDTGKAEDIPALAVALANEGGRLLAESDDRSLILRATLTGSGVLHEDLSREGAIAAILAQLREESGGGSPFVWWESIHDDTKPLLDYEAIAKRGDFAAAVLELADALEGDPEEFRGFVDSYLTGLPAGELAGMGVSLGEATGPSLLAEAVDLAMDLLVGDQG